MVSSELGLGRDELWEVFNEVTAGNEETFLGIEQTIEE
jgi:hypothetical protein